MIIKKINMKWFKLFFPVTMLMALQGFGQVGKRLKQFQF